MTHFLDRGHSQLVAKKAISKYPLPRRCASHLSIGAGIGSALRCNMAVFARPWVVTLLAAIYAICAASAQQQAASGVSSQLTRIRSGVVIADGALCDNKVSAYFVSDNVQLTSTNVLFYGDVTEEQCAAMCSDNKDIKGRTILCASFNYDHVSFSCRIFREKSKPDGIASVRASPGERFFEKFCLPSSAPLDCGESHFYRADQAVLVGYAKNATIVKTLEECVAVCLNEAFPCKSAMFFYEEGECITNTESAESMPEVFAKEEVDKVVYFENACLNPNAYKNPKNEKHASGGRQTVQKQPQQQQQRQEIKKSIAPEAPKATAAPNVASTTEPKNRIHVTMKHRGRASKIVEVADTDDLPLPGYSAWSAWSHCDRPDGRRVRRRECELVKCTEKLLQVQWCRDINPDELTTTTKEPTSTTTVTPPPTTRPPSTTTSLWETAWSPWEGVCQKFSNGQVCNHGVLIGFETRRCNGNPFLCQGPFFRYCTMDC